MSTNGRPIMSVQIEKITPTRAKELLTKNTHNRNLRVLYVEQLAGAMERDEWMPSTDAVSIATDGTILNGQHRLRAIVESKRTISLMVAYNVPNSAQETMDIGRRRSVGDMLKLRGRTNVSVLAASARLYWHYTTFGSLQPAHPRPTTQQVIAVAEEHRNLILGYALAERIARVLPVTPTLTCALWTLFIEREDYETVSRFWDLLEAGEGLRQGDVIYTLRQQLHRLGRQNSMKRPPTWVVGALIVKAFNYWREGRNVEILLFKPGIEPFPLIEESRIAISA